MKSLIFRCYTAIRHQFRFLALVCLVCTASQAHAQMPEGTIGWTYYAGLLDTDEHAADPITACAKTAMKHMGRPLLAMRPNGNRGDQFDCQYSHFLAAGGIQWFGSTLLQCKSGYTPRWPGICVKRDEPPPPPTCSISQPGHTVGNPVQLASGAKIQTETDVAVGQPDGLRVSRTYRSLRNTGKAQSGGFGWSFSFDRSFYLGVAGASTVSGTLGDGSYFQFKQKPDGSFVSQHDKLMTLVALSTEYTDWILTTSDGRVEKYRKSNGDFKLISSHSRSGEGQFYFYDTEGQLTRIEGADGRTINITWNAGVVAAVDGPNGGARYEYDQASTPGQNSIEGMARLVAVHYHDRAGAELSTTRYHYEDERQRFLLTGVTDENGARFATYAYNETAQTVMSEHAGGANRYEFAYPNEMLRVVTDPLGTVRTAGILYSADRLGRVTGESQPAGAGCGAGASSLTYTADGSLESSTDFNGQKTCYINDAARGLETSRFSGLPAGSVCPVSAAKLSVNSARMVSTRWHADWPVVSSLAEPNRIVTNVYNGEPGSDGRVVQCAGGAVLPNGKPILVLCSKTEQATTDSNGTLGFNAVPVGTLRVWRYTYTSTGKLLTRIGPSDASGNVDSARLTYYADTTDSHAAGDLETSANGAGEVTTFLEYGPDGLASKIRSFQGQITTLKYGPRGRLATSTVEGSGRLSETTRYEYDDVGQLTRMVAPDGSAIGYTYDLAHRLTDLRDNLGNTVHFTLDNMGNVTNQEVRGPGGDLVTQAQRSYDALNRLQRQQRDAADMGTRYEYDRGGNPTSVTDPLGRRTSQVFDSYDRVVAQTLPAPAPGAAAPVIGFGYSQQDQLLSVTDPRKLTTRYTVDGFGQRTAVISPDTGTTTSQFDGAGNPDFQIDATGRKTTYRFDAAQRITQRGTSTFEYGKDGSGATGRLTQMNDESGQSSYAYDGFGRLLAKRQTVGTGATAKTLALAYTYGSTGASVGHVTSMTYPSGNRIDIAYGADGRALSLAVTAPGTASTPLLGDIRYQPFGAVRGWAWGNSTAVSPNLYQRSFDLDGKIVSYPLGHPANNGTVRTLSYDAAGRITASRHTGAPAAAALDQRYDYDNLDRLTGFDSAGTSQRFQYDANGNRTQATFGANTYRNLIDPASNRLSSTSGPAPARQNLYDAAGNLTKDGTIAYSYGSNGRLSGVTVAGVATSYRYNGLGQRVAKTGTAGIAVHYVYDESGRLLGEYDSSGKAIQETVYLGDLPVAVLKPDGNAGTNQVAASSINYVYADHLSTPRVLTRASDNKMVWRWDNGDPFGLDQPDQNPSRLGELIYNPRFPGQVFDSETNNHYNYYRNYDPQTGRYMQSDPIGLRGGINTYGYVGGNPVSYVDPLGQARKGGKTGEWWEFTDRNFQRWFHLCIKGPGDADANRADLAEAYRMWVKYGKPDGKNGCGGPPPPPAPACGETCKTTANVVVAGGTAYLVYRCLRMVPSLLPPLWPTIPANLAIP